jgi:hypothetical protein
MASPSPQASTVRRCGGWAGAGEGGKLALPLCLAPAKRPEPAPAGESTGRRNVRIGDALAKARDGICGGFGGYSLCRQPGADCSQRIAAPMQRSRPGGGVSRIIQKPRFLVPSDDRIDLLSDLLSRIRGVPPDAADQNAPQILR